MPTSPDSPFTPRWKAVLDKHRRHVELSPGAGKDAQNYALAVIADIEADFVHDSPRSETVPTDSPRWKEIDELCEGRSKIDLAEIILRERAARTEIRDSVTVAKSFARRVERHLAAYGQAELDRQALADMIAEAK